jgi:putative transposase
MQAMQDKMKAMRAMGGSIATDGAVSKLFYLALNNISKKWTMPIRD